MKPLLALVPACILFSGSIVLFCRGKTLCSFLQILGAGCLVVVILAHVLEAFHLLPWMHWGSKHSVGHYSISGVLFLVSRCFLLGTCFTHLQSDTLMCSRTGVRIDMKRTLLSWSSGKDSAWSLHLLRQQSEYEIIGLLTTFNQAANRVAITRCVVASSKRRQKRQAFLCGTWICPGHARMQTRSAS